MSDAGQTTDARRRRYWWIGPLVVLVVLGSVLVAVTEKKKARIPVSHPAPLAAHPAALIVPDLKLTPGSVRTTDLALICGAGTKALRHWSRERDDRILRAYGLPPGAHPDFEIDHSIPLGIGGDDSDRNLWAQPRRSIEPTWNAEAKDRLEGFLREEICAGRLDAKKAQRDIAADWMGLYERTFLKP